MFVLTDTDGNGYISDDELNVIMEYLAHRGAPQMTSDHCVKSENGEINFDDFNHCLFHNFVDDDVSLWALSAFDVDGNGEIDV